MSPSRRQTPSVDQLSKPAPGRVGVWLFGALGGLATTVVAGARAMAKGLSGPQGLLTETELFAGIPLAPMAPH